MDAVKTIMKRDNISKKEAMKIVRDAKEEMMNLIEMGMFEDAEYVWQEATGLEIDYAI
jgi:predicted small secreted protein